MKMSLAKTVMTVALLLISGAHGSATPHEHVHSSSHSYSRPYQIKNYTADQMIAGTTVNLMWIDAESTTRDTLIPKVFSRKSREENKMIDIDIFKRMEEWAEHFHVVMWYDSEMLFQRSDTKEKKAEKLRHMVDETVQIIKTLKNHERIKLRDIREFKIVKEHPRVFSSQEPLTFRADLARILVSFEEFDEVSPRFSVYADLSILPLTPKKLMDDHTVKLLNEYGIVMAKSPIPTMVGCENSFHIISNIQDQLFDVLDNFLIKKSLDAPDAVGRYVWERDLPTYTYGLLKPMFQIYYALIGKATLTNEKGESLNDSNIKDVNGKWVSLKTNQPVGKLVLSPEVQIEYGGTFIPVKDVGAPHSNHAF